MRCPPKRVNSSIRIRESLAAALGVGFEELPFAGELLQVRPDEGAWEGAIERLLHGFALSLLVPDSLHAQVSHYVDRTHLRGRLVYLRIRESSVRGAPRSASPHSVVRKVEIRPDSPFYAFLERDLTENDDYTCCESIEQFNRIPRALTRAGQIKANERRHEKDDRRAIDDRSRYVLGWDNQAKLKLFRAEQKEVRRRLVGINAERERLRQQQRDCDQRMRAAETLIELKDFARIDWRGSAAAIQRLEDEKRALEESDDRLRTLREQLYELEQRYAAGDAQRENASSRLGGIQTRLNDLQSDRDAAQREQDSMPQDNITRHAARLEELSAQALGKVCAGERAAWI